MRWPGLKALPCFLCTLWLPGPLVAGPAEITAIVINLKQLQRTEDVQLIRAASTAREPLVLGAKLELGDSLEGLSGKTVVELKCLNGTIYTFRNHFRVVLVPPSQAGCAVDVLNGGLDVLADRPTEVNSGGVRLGSEGTVYSVTVNSSAGSARLRIAVLEGQVKISGDEPIGQGAVLAIREKDRSRSQIDPAQDILPLAATFARLDVARAENAERDSEAFRTLKVLHAQVLTMPEDPERRIALARAQLHYGVQNGNASYQLRRLGMTERELQLDPEPLDRPDPAQGGASVCTVQILEQRFEEVEGEIELEGSARIPDGHHLWLFVRRINTPLWWPHKGTFDAKTGEWSAFAAKVHSDFELMAAVVTEEQNRELQGTLSQQSGESQPIEMPTATCVAAVVKVRKPSPPVPPQSDVLDCAVRVLEPRPGQEVESRIVVTGSASIPAGHHHLWVFARRVDFRLAALWWPQGEGTFDASNGRWSVVTTLGGFQDVGWEFELTAAVFTQQQQQELLGYLHNSMKSGDFRPMEMPAAVCAAAVVEVKRTN